MRKKSMKSWAKIALTIGAFMFIANSASAAQYYGLTGGNWADTNTWTTPGNGTIPGSADTPFIRNGTFTINSDVGSINFTYIGDSTNYGTGILNITTGGKLVSLYGGTATRTAVGRPLNGTLATRGYLNLSGGTLQMGAGSSGTNVLNVGVNPNAGTNALGTFTISGGTFNGRLLVGADNGWGAAGEDIVRIVGNAATIGSQFNDGGSAISMDVRATGRLEFIFGATGISTMNFADGVNFSTGSQIFIDGAAYTGGTQTFELIKSTALSAVTTPTIVLTNFAAGSTYSYNTSTDVLSVTVSAIPEPATIGMIGVGALVAILVRRQMRA